jgi:hypothetical protein
MSPNNWPDYGPKLLGVAKTFGDFLGLNHKSPYDLLTTFGFLLEYLPVVIALFEGYEKICRIHSGRVNTGS